MKCLNKEIASIGNCYRSRKRLRPYLIAAVVGLAVLIVEITACSPIRRTSKEYPLEATAAIVRGNEKFIFEAPATAFFGNSPLLSEGSTPTLSGNETAQDEVYYEKAIVTTGLLEYQIKGLSPVSAGVNSNVPLGADVRTWSNNTIVKIELDDGSVIMLDPFTTIYIRKNEQNTGSEFMISLERGGVLVVSGSLWVVSADLGFKIWANGSMVGISYEPLQITITVSCFGPAGSCQFIGLNDSDTLTPGQQLQYEESIRGEIGNVDLKQWLALYSDILPSPTITPNPGLTITPSIVPTIIPASATPTTQNPSDEIKDPETRLEDGGDVDDGGEGG